MSVVNLELACQKIFKISARRYRQLVKEYNAPPVVKGKVDILRACEFLISYYRNLAEGQGSVSLTEERARLTKIQADMRYLEYQRKKNELIEKQEALNLFTHILLQMANRLNLMPLKLAPLVISAGSLGVAQEILSKGIKEVLDEVTGAEFIRNCLNNYTSVPSNKAKATSDSKSMGRRKKNNK